MGNKIKTTAEALEASALPDAYSVQVSDSGETVAQNQSLPKAVAQKAVADKSAAEWAYERMVLYIQEFEKQLDSDHEVGMGFAGGDVGTLKIQGMGYFAPDMITFYGTDPDGAKTQLVQHVNQLNVMLVAAPKENLEEEPSRIGFKLAIQLDEKAKA